MLKAHRARTSIAGRLGVATLGLAALGLTATGGIAQTAPEPETATAPKVERFVIRRGEGTDAASVARIEAEGGGAAVREFLLKRGEGAPEAFFQRECADGQRFESSTTSDAGKPIKVFLCQKGEGADRLSALRTAQGRIAANTHLSAEEKARVEAALEAAIAQAQ